MGTQRSEISVLGNDTASPGSRIITQ
jgi:hypothetical protein